MHGVPYQDVYLTMHEGLWEKVVALDGADTARRAKCEYMPASGNYEVALLGCSYVVEPAERRIYPSKISPQGHEAGFLEQLCILAYLINARELPLAKKLVRAEALEAGSFFFRGPHALPTDKLVEAFGDEPALLTEAGKRLRAKICDYPDASIELSVLPRFPLTLVVWGGDAEFDGRASVLFDQTAGDQLPLDAIGAAVNLAVEMVITSSGKTS
jgi:hypothetical protein